MRKDLVYKLVLILQGLTAMVYSQAQGSFAYKAKLSGVHKAGFYKIVLLPSIVARSRADLKDLRIYAGGSRQVPYILKEDLPSFSQSNFSEFPIRSIRKETDKQTHIVFENITGKIVSELLLVIKNTDANRVVTLSGSEDSKRWFVVKEDLVLNNVFNPGKDRFVQALSFPASSYRFFKLIIHGENLLPLNIVSIGTYEGLYRDGTFLPLPSPSFIQKDSTDKRSYITLDFDDEYLINRLDLTVAAPKFFKRRLTVNKIAGGTSFVAEYSLSSNGPWRYELNVKAKHLVLIIENEDNPPLEIGSINAWQLNKYMLTYMESGNMYELFVGDAHATAPRYDLEFFKDSIGNGTSQLTVGALENNHVITSVDKATGNNYNSLLLWSVIVAVLVLLLVLTLRMIREVHSKGQE